MTNVIKSIVLYVFSTYGLLNRMVRPWRETIFTKPFTLKKKNTLVN